MIGLLVVIYLWAFKLMFYHLKTRRIITAIAATCNNGTRESHEQGLITIEHMYTNKHVLNF